VPNALDHPAVQRVLESAARKGVTLEVTVFADSTHTASDAAREIGADVAQIVKSLVFVTTRDDGTPEPIICLVSGSSRVDLDRLAAVVGRRDIRRSTAREAGELTGFTIGGIPPFGHTQRARVIMDPELSLYETVWAAAGLPTAVFPVAPATLRMLADAHVAPIAETPSSEGAAAGSVSADARREPAS
jgi:prolyl-tRNA editing enzyme YbaK/EbsC (Cys-tRNA(Pro) deacylase)